MDWGPVLAASASAIAGSLGGGPQGASSRRERDLERQLRRWINSAAARQTFGPGSEWNLPPGASELGMPVMDYSGAVSGTHWLGNEAIDLARQTGLGEQYGADIYGTAGDYSTAAIEAAGGALGQAYSGLTGDLGVDTTMAEQMAQQYASNPYLDDMVAASLRDAELALGRDKARMMMAANQATGGFTKRHGVEQTLLDIRALDRAADVSAQLRGQTYQTGLGQGMQAALADQQAELNRLGQLGSMGMNLGGLAGEYMRAGTAGATLAARDQAQRIEQLRKMGASERDIENQLNYARAMEAYMKEMAPYAAIDWMRGSYLGDPEVTGTTGASYPPWASAVGAAAAGMNLYNEIFTPGDDTEEETGFGALGNWSF